MVCKMNNEKQYPTWEVLALLVGFVGSAGLVPELINIFLNLYPDMKDASRSFKIICILIYLVVLLIMGRFSQDSVSHRS